MKIIIFMLTRRRQIGRRCYISPDVFRVNFTFSLHVSCVYVIKQYIALHSLMLKTSALKGYITLAFCILVIDTRKQFQLQTGVFLKRPDVVTFDETIRSLSFLSN